MPRVTKRQNYMIEVGIKLGYPRCCSISFVFDRPIDSRRQEAGHVDGKATGFVPCICCAEKIFKGEVKLVDLIKDRQISAEFPNAEGTEEFRELVAPLCK